MKIISRLQQSRDFCESIGLLCISVHSILQCRPRNNLNHWLFPWPFTSAKQYGNSGRLTPGLSAEMYVFPIQLRRKSAI